MANMRELQESSEAKDMKHRGIWKKGSSLGEGKTSVSESDSDCPAAHM